MQILRSLTFNVLFYAVLIAFLLAGLPLMLAGRKGVYLLARAWTRVTLWMFETICGVKHEVRGLERLPPGAVIVAAKHQSFWETFALSLYVPEFTFILKRELMWLPFFGWYLKAAGMIAIDRKSGSSALRQVIERSRPILAEGRQLVIFPEGTRRPPGAPPEFKYGVAHIYSANDVPCVPVALNSGLFWPRRKFIRRPGTVVVEFLEPIEPGLPRDEFFATLQERLEAGSNRLLEEAVAHDPRLAEGVYRHQAAAPANR